MSQTTIISERPTSWLLFKEITKFRLSISVLFSSVAGYFLGAEFIRFDVLALLIIGGYCMVGASNVFNQIIERDLDALMERTKLRPLPAGHMTVNRALALGLILTLIGLTALYWINPKTAMFGAISIFLYVSVYTPLKTKTPLSVFVGALPGAIPFMLGWVAAAGSFGIEPGTLFMIQFFWQFPHFWAIGWFLDDDYKKAGFQMLPVIENESNRTNRQILWHAFLLIPVSLFFVVTGILGEIYFWGASALGFGYLISGIPLLKDTTVDNAKLLLKTSVIYLPALLIVIFIDLNS